MKHHYYTPFQLTGLNPRCHLPLYHLSRPAKLAATILFLAVATALQAQLETGEVAGRVFNAATGAALRNARVALERNTQETTTDDSGAYRLSRIPAGPTNLTVQYLGFSAQTTSVIVTGGGTAQRDFELSLAIASEPVKLAAFTVVVDREMSAQAIALNERRASPNIKNVVAYDEYGDRGAENIGEFLRFLPGVAVAEAGQSPDGVMLRGFPSNHSPIQVDGTDIANSRGNSRSQFLSDIPMGNISRVEVTKVPTPDMPASGLGGSLNVIRKSVFESKQAVFAYKLYHVIDTNNGVTIDGGPRGFTPALSPNFKQPSAELSYLLPLNKTLGFSFSGSRTWRMKSMNRDDFLDTQPDWNLVNGYQRLSTWQAPESITTTWAAQLGADWKISARDVLSANLQVRSVVSDLMRVDFIANYGAGASGGRSFTQGAAAGVGQITQASGDNQVYGVDTKMGSLKYQHRGADWQLEALGTFSSSKGFNQDVDKGYFQNATATLTGLVLRGEGIGEDEGGIPVRYSANRGGAPIDVFRGANYVLGNPTSAQDQRLAYYYAGRLDLSREFHGRLPLKLKAGIAVNRTERYRRNFNKTWVFSPHGSTSTTARSAGNFAVFDSDFNAEAPTIFGQQMDWVSVAKYYQLYEQNPEWFVLNQALYHQNLATSSSKLFETISAAYLRGDLHLFARRLWLVGGLRIEQTRDEGWGVRNDPSAQYLKDASGNLLLNPSRQPILITTDAVARAKLRYLERGTHAARDYGNGYPSLGATWNLGENLVVRASYARTLGRPDLSNIVPGSVLSEPTAVEPSISVNNTGLKPWRSDNYDLSLESYQIKGGSGAIGIFQKNLKDFFGSVTTPATPALLELYGLPNDPSYLGYNLTTLTNTGDAQIRGAEFSYLQSLYFLPPWARGLQVFFNATRLELDGANEADFTGYSPTNYAGGINLIRPRFSLKLSFTYQGETRNALIAPSIANGIPANTYGYQRQRLNTLIDAQYSLSRHFALYGSVKNLGGYTGGNRRYAPDTPAYMKDRRRQEYPSTVVLGIKGRF